MKKNYLKPAINAQTISVKSAMLVESLPDLDPESGIVDNPTDPFLIKDISSDLFGNESFGGAEEW